jgi:hypothetical protein
MELIKIFIHLINSDSIFKILSLFITTFFLKYATDLYSIKLATDSANAQLALLTLELSNVKAANISTGANVSKLLTSVEFQSWLPVIGWVLVIGGIIYTLNFFSGGRDLQLDLEMCSRITAQNQELSRQLLDSQTTISSQISLQFLEQTKHISLVQSLCEIILRQTEKEIVDNSTALGDTVVDLLFR